MNRHVSEPDPGAAGNHDLCPWWVGYLLASPLRRLSENPEVVFGDLVEKGMTVVDVGSAMGFFSLPLARMVGSEGRVVCLDVQERMLTTLKRRARRRKLDGIIETRLCSQETLGIDDLEASVDLIAAIHVMHETSNQPKVLAECSAALRSGGRLLLAEPSAHVSTEEFDKTCSTAIECGFQESGKSPLRKSHSALLMK